VHRTVQLLARDTLGDPRFGELGLAWGQSGTAAALAVVESPGVAVASAAGSIGA
jgi:hypothetical protein